jgi:hypothetical protein
MKCFVEKAQDKLGKVLKDKLEPVVQESLPLEMIELVQQMKKKLSATIIPFRCNNNGAVVFLPLRRLDRNGWERCSTLSNGLAQMPHLRS